MCGCVSFLRLASRWSVNSENKSFSAMSDDCECPRVEVANLRKRVRNLEWQMILVVLMLLILGV